MKKTIRCVSVTRVDGDIHVRWSDKTVDVYRDRRHMKEFIRQQISDETLKALCLASILFDDDATPLSQATRRRATFDTTTPNALLTVVETQS